MTLEEKKLQPIWCVYVHIIPKEISGYDHNKYYVGISSNTKRRWQKDGSGYKTQFFWKAINKYGWDNIEHRILFDGLDEESAVYLENKVICSLRSNEKEFGYNANEGGEGVRGVVFTDEMRKKRSETLCNLWKDQEYRAYRKRQMTEYGNRPEVKEKKRAIFKKNWEDPEFRKRQIENAKRNYSMKPLPGDSNPSAKPVVNINTGEVFSWAGAAAEAYHVCRQTIIDAIGHYCQSNGSGREKQKTCGKDSIGRKCVWMHYEDYVRLSEHEIEDIIKNKNTYPIDNRVRAVIDIDTNTVFRSSKDASMYYTGKDTGKNGIMACARGVPGRKTAIDHHWKYYDDYLKENNLTDEEARKSLYFIT